MQKSFNFFVVLTLASFILTKGNLIYKEDNDLDAKISTKQENARKVRSAPHAGFCEPEDPEILFQSQVVSSTFIYFKAYGVSIMFLRNCYFTKLFLFLS